jgi:hypothetical protein
MPVWMNNGAIENIRLRKRNALPLTIRPDRTQLATDATVDFSIFDGLDFNEDLFEGAAVRIR